MRHKSPKERVVIDHPLSVSAQAGTWENKNVLFFERAITKIAQAFYTPEGCLLRDLISSAYLILRWTSTTKLNADAAAVSIKMSCGMIPETGAL